MALPASNNPGVTVTGLIALAGECWDANGNKLSPGSVMIRVINGAIATIAITETNINPGAGSETVTGQSATVTPGTVTPIAPTGAAALIAGVAPTVAVS